MERILEDKELIWIAECLAADYANSKHDVYYIKILDRNTYRSLVELFNITKELFEIFKLIMKYDRYCLQYIEHSVLGEAAKLKLRQSPHKRIKEFNELKQNEQDFYLGP